MAILSQIWVVLSAPQGPQYLTSMAPVGSKFSLILPPESKGIKLTCLCSQRVKLSCFSQKRPFWVKFGGVFRPQDPHYLTGTTPVGSKFYPKLPLYVEGKKLTCFCNQRVKWSCFRLKTAILSQILGVFWPPAPPILDQDGPSGLQILPTTPL